MLRRALLALALVAALPAAAREPPYLTVQDLDLVTILPPPVVDPEQLALVLAAQRAATPERIEQAKRDVDESPDTMFGAVLGKSLDERALPATARLFSRMRDTEDAVVGPDQEGVQARAPLHEQHRGQGAGAALDQRLLSVGPHHERHPGRHRHGRHRAREARRDLAARRRLQPQPRRRRHALSQRSFRRQARRHRDRRGAAEPPRVQGRLRLGPARAQAVSGLSQ